jgi:predicted O-methyltransferase YrrM
MSNKYLRLDDRIYEYLRAVSLREHGALRRLREETARMSQAQMQIAPEQGQLMALLVQLLGARRTLEVGVFTSRSRRTAASSPAT